MRIVSLNRAPSRVLRYRNAKPGGGGTFVADLPVLDGRVDALPEGVDCLVLTSDLQGRELSGTRLLGEVVPAFLRDEVGVPASAIALLAGDLYAAPRADERGATGDVRPTWLAFAEAFRAVAGVNGNHDTFGEESPSDFAQRARVHILDGQARDVDGLRVGGVSGIVGKLSKPNRKDRDTFTRLLEDVLLDGAHVVLLHQGPEGEGPGDKGSPWVRDAILALDAPPLVAFGHCHWHEPLLEVDARQMLNLDGRVVVLRAA